MLIINYKNNKKIRAAFDKKLQTKLKNMEIIIKPG